MQHRDDEHGAIVSQSPAELAKARHFLTGVRRSLDEIDRETTVSGLRQLLRSNEASSQLNVRLISLAFAGAGREPRGCPRHRLRNLDIPTCRIDLVVNCIAQH